MTRPSPPLDIIARTRSKCRLASSPACARPGFLVACCSAAPTSPMKPADYPFRIRVLLVATLFLFVINVFFFFGPLAALEILTPTEFLDQIARSPRAARELIQRLSQRLREADDRIVNDERRSPTQQELREQVILFLFETWRHDAQSHLLVSADSEADRPSTFNGLCDPGPHLVQFSALSLPALRRGP
jgi:hypothetical protein